ncbi:MAG: ATP-binding protein [Gammaproteobacteria bacterium]|nr:ATP-binding protein [Gammaproteobacteria bacterium]
MGAVFAALGAGLGFLISFYNRVIETEQRRVHWLERELNVHLPSLIAGGENEQLEFKSTLRWNLREERADKALEKVIVKSLAGLMNHRGGSLIIGVSDAGETIGINSDFQTLKHKNADGFEQALMDLVRSALGTHACALIHCQFPLLDEALVCWLVVEQAKTPVFVQDGKVARYMVRTGNSTRELDAREVYAHVSQRQ